MPEHREQTLAERVGRLLLQLIALVAISFGFVGCYYNAHDGYVFGAIAWLVLGLTINVLCRIAAKL